MRIIKFFEDQVVNEVETLNNVFKINKKVLQLHLSIPCKVNLKYGVEEKVVFNTDMLSLRWGVEKGVLSIEKTHSFNSSGQQDSVDIYLNSKIRLLKVGNETELDTHDFMLFDQIDITDNSDVTIQKVDVRSLKINTEVESKIKILGSKNPLNEIDIESKGESKVDTIQLNVIKGNVNTAGFAVVSSFIAEEVNTTIQGLSQQFIYGEPPVVNKNIIGGMGNFELKRNK